MDKKGRNVMVVFGVISTILLLGVNWAGRSGFWGEKSARGTDRQWGIFSGKRAGQTDWPDGDQTIAGSHLAEESLPLPQQQTQGEGREVKGYVALTFDDGPHPVYTPRLLEGLKERGARATFFLIGQNIDGNEDVIRKMKEDGHLIGNHSQNHMQLTRERAGEACEQINRTNEKIRQITGETPEYVRPPYGSWSEELECLVPMRVVLWNLDTLDWKTQNKDKIVSHVMSHVEDGSVILLHDVYDTSVEAALEIVDRLLAEGYNFVTVDELIID